MQLEDTRKTFNGSLADEEKEDRLTPRASNGIRLGLVGAITITVVIITFDHHSLRV